MSGTCSEETPRRGGTQPIPRKFLAKEILANFLMDYGVAAPAEPRDLLEYLERVLRFLVRAWDGNIGWPASVKTQGLMKAIDTAQAATIKDDKSNPPPACRVGCNFCCKSERIVVSEEEAVLAVGAVAKMDSATRAGVMSNIDNCVATATATRTATGSPCVFLVKGRCSIYDQRPIACRTYLSPCAKACEKRLASGSRVDAYRKALILGYAARAVKDGYGGVRFEMNTLMRRIFESDNRLARWVSGHPTAETDIQADLDNPPVPMIPR